MIKYSIVIPVKAINNYVRETVTHIQAISRDDWELIIVPNNIEGDEWLDSRITFLKSGSKGPATKRDMAAKVCNGSILVFLDDDSYPQADLLDVADKYFADNQLVAIGGPGITPKSDSFGQKLSGAVFLSKYSGGSPERYLSIGQPKEVDDWPSVNLMVRKKEFLQVGGFDNEFWPGEDTKLCQKLIENTQKKIKYVPELIVWHHRRSGWLAHMKQVGAYGLHRGYFARVYKGSSLRFKYFIPSLFFLFSLGSMISIIYINSKLMNAAISIGWILYTGILIKSLSDIKKHEGIYIAIASILYIVPTQLIYGLKFIQGICTKELKSKLR